MIPEVRDAIYAHALQTWPRECCGVVVDDQRYIPCRNIAATPAEHFMLHPDDYANAEDAGKITWIVHSHPNVPARPSHGDKASCEAMGIPYFIVAVYKEAQDLIPRVVGDAAFAPSGWTAPYIGREYQFGVLDCYTLIHDWYTREWGMPMPKVDRRDGFWTTSDGPEHYMSRYEEYGFAPVTDGSLQYGDMILMQIRSKVQANHAGVYVGNGRILHHLYNRLSTEEMYNAGMRRMTRLVVRRTDR
jgi:proteasome lid subunit RPN8/RPN11